MMGGGGTPDLEITLRSSESPVNYAGESRTFKVTVNLNSDIIPTPMMLYLEAMN
jgi:hypothetical protein